MMKGPFAINMSSIKENSYAEMDPRLQGLLSNTYKVTSFLNSIIGHAAKNLRGAFPNDVEA
jgi:hypothetical protein